MATITLSDANADGTGVDLLDYLNTYDSTFARGSFGFFSDSALDLAGNQYAFSEAASSTVSGVPSTADSVVIGSGSGGDFTYNYSVHTLDGTLDSVSFGQGLSYSSGTDSFSQSATDVAISGLGLSGSGTGNPVHTLIYDLMGGSTSVLLSTLNAQNNTIVGSSGDDIIQSFDGADTLTGGAGYDTFVFDGTDGSDTITDFSVVEDTINVTAWASSSYSDLSISYSGGNAVVAYGANSITLLNVAENTLSSEFVLA